MAKKELTPDELVDTHKPKHVKYKYVFTDDALLNDLLVMHYDMTTLDTICNDDLVNAALEAEFVDYERTIIGKSTEPTFLDNGVIISRKMVTKADKKLLKVSIGFFTYSDSRYVTMKLTYEKFVIVEIYNLI